MPNHNLQRLSEDIKREISAAIRNSKDERISLGMFSVTRCEVTSDLSYCKVYVSSLQGGEKTDEAVQVLGKASGYFKSEIAKRVKMRKIPQLIFTPDRSMEYYERISNIIDNLSETKENHE
jgi:ribosome-binding factor A